MLKRPNRNNRYRRHASAMQDDLNEERENTQERQKAALYRRRREMLEAKLEEYIKSHW